MPKVVAFGGGHGLANVLQSARLYADKITAVVSVADDGGSTGELRKEYNIPAPGDIRRCLSALSDTNNRLLAEHLESRFEFGHLHNHAIGNLILAGLSLACEDFQAAIDELSHLINAQGSVYPATQQSVQLVADVKNEKIVGQVAIEQACRTGLEVKNLRFDLEEVSIHPQVIADLTEADQIIYGPGDLLTSVIAALINPRIQAAISSSKATKIFVANIKPLNSFRYQLELLQEYDFIPDLTIIPCKDNKKSSQNTQILEAPEIANSDKHDPKLLAAILQKI